MKTEMEMSVAALASAARISVRYQP